MPWLRESIGAESRTRNETSRQRGLLCARGRSARSCVSGPLLTQTSSRGWGRAIGDAQLAHIAGRELLRSRCPHHDPATQQEGAALPEVELGVLGGHKKHFGDVVSGWSSLPWLIDQATCQPYVTSRRPDQERLGANPGPCQQSPLSFNTRVT